ncbi:MAG: GTP-binding protein [Thermoplasmata archaeon]|nr:MAG: GTP-binding protein [Thermoplasmata archaeon]
MKKEIIKKMCVLGDGAVGKTSLIRRFVYDTFDDIYITTIGSKTTAKVLHIPFGNESIMLKLQIWDLLGQKGFAKLHVSSFKGANGVFMVTDITRKETLDSLEEYWIPKVQSLVGNIPFVILANKRDLMRKAKFTQEDLREFASRYNVPYYLTSAKNGRNVNQAFYALGRNMMDPRIGKPKFPSRPKIIHPHQIFEGERVEFARIIDIIIDDFCKGYSDFEDGMSVLERQFEMAKLDLSNPTIEALKRALDRLELVEQGIKKREIARADHLKRLRWLEEIQLGT